MHEQTGALAAVTFGYFDEDEDGDTIVKEQQGTYTLTVTDLPDDMEWSAGMTVTIHPAPKETPMEHDDQQCSNPETLCDDCLYYGAQENR